MRYGLIAGNGRFPVLALENARKLGHEVVAIGILEEASREIEPLAARCHWISLGELSRLIDILKAEGITEVMMAGQVKHASIFSSIRPDWRLFKVLAALPRKNTDSLIGAVQKVLADEGIELVDSTLLLKPLLAPAGVLTKRKPDSDERRDIEYGLSFYRNREVMNYDQSGVPDEQHLLVARMTGRGGVDLRTEAALDAYLEGRHYEEVFSWPEQGLDVYLVGAR